MKKLFTLIFSLMLAQSIMAQICPVFITHILTGNQVQYYASCPDNPATWSWFFNGGTPQFSSIQNPLITYNIPGNYICACSVSGGLNNCSASLSSGQDSVTILGSGVPEIKKINDVQIFSRGSIPTFEIESNSTQTVRVELFDINGSLIDLVFKGNLNGGANIFQMRPIDLPIGNYVLNILTEQGKITRKFHWNN